MAENREYYTQNAENGTVQISEDVVASIAAAAILETEGVCGLSANLTSDIAEMMLGKKNPAKGIRLTGAKDGALCIECDVVAKFGAAVFELGKTLQDVVKNSVESVTGLTVQQVNVNICGVALPREGKK